MPEPDTVADLSRRDEACRRMAGQIGSRVLRRQANVERLFAAMDRLAVEAERRGLTNEILEAELVAYNAERRGRGRDCPPPAQGEGADPEAAGRDQEPTGGA